MRTLIVGIVAASAFAIGAATAEEVIVEDAFVDDDYAPAVIEDDDDDAVLVTRPARVYGWSYRLGNCGTYKYWNGHRCADARFEPTVK
jgi:hypothetical protein